jgi:hypothetical protein
MHRSAHFKMRAGSQGPGARERKLASLAMSFEMMRAKRATFPRPLTPGPWPLLLVLLLLPLPGSSQQPIHREADGWVRTYTGTLPKATRLRINGHGPVTLDAGGHSFTYSIRVSIAARSEAEARRLFERLPLHIATQGDWVVLTAPGGPALAAVTVKAPHLTNAAITTSDGAVEASGIDGTLDADTRAGEIAVDRVRGQCTLVTGGGQVRVGEVDGPLRCTSSAGRITVKTVRGPAVLYTNGGDIQADQVGGESRIETMGGSIHVRAVSGTLTATSGGGEIVVEKADGVVTARNMMGPVQVGAAAGVHCENGSGGIRISHIAGPIRVSTAMGSILADLAGGRLSDSFLATASGDITVVIPSNVGVTVRAENSMADTLRRIVSDYAALSARRVADRIVAQGAINGGGPVLQISDTRGTIFIKKQ